jgi:hypothetical protein
LQLLGGLGADVKHRKAAMVAIAMIVALSGVIVPAEAAGRLGVAQPVPRGTSVWSQYENRGYDSPVVKTLYIRRRGSSLRIATIGVLHDPATGRASSVDVTCATGTVTGGKSIAFFPGRNGADFLKVARGILTDTDPSNSSNLIWTKYKRSSRSGTVASIAREYGRETRAALQFRIDECL